MIFRIEYGIEADGRWIAEAPEISGVLAYGTILEEPVSLPCPLQTPNPLY